MFGVNNEYRLYHTDSFISYASVSYTWKSFFKDNLQKNFIKIH